MSSQSGNRSLLSLGAAAVLAVYSAGYARTEEAAERFADEASKRRNNRPEPKAAPTPVEPAATKPAVAPKAKSAPKKIAIAPKAQDTNIIAKMVDTAVAIAPAAAPAEPAKDTTTKPAVDSTRSAQWKDGRFSAWGYSRHGDLEATVEIKDGRIVSAEITQCYTRYPCSRISPLPPQVAERQSDSVDVVSRVTESSDAFYWAVKEALKKAKP